MTLLLNVYRNGVWLALPVLCLAAILLVSVIFNLVALMRKSVILRLPLAELQEVEFAEAGTVILCMEGPLLSTRFRGLRYSLADMTGAAVPGRGVLPMSSSGFSRGRRTLWRFTIPQAGRYVLRVEPLGNPQPKDADHEFVFTRPHFAWVVAHILGIIASSGLLIGSLVLFALRLLDKSPDLNAASSASSSTLVAVVWIACVFIAAFLLMLWTTRGHRNAVRQLASAQGWAISDTDTLGLGLVVGDLFPDRTFTCSQIMTVESDARRLYLVDGTYSHKGPNVDAHLASVCVLESERLQGVTCRVEIRVRNWLDKAMLPGQVTLGDSAFARQCIVISEAALAAQNLVNPALQEILVAHATQPLYNPVEIAIDRGRMTLITTYITDNACWLDLADLARRIEEVL